jgi:Holliday junction resolvasome RuvABC endonuclease subunit
MVVGVDFSTKALHCAFGDQAPQLARLDVAAAAKELQVGLICDLLGGLLDRLEPGLLVVERPWGGTNARTVVQMGQIQGAVMAVAHSHGWVVYEADPSTMRREVIGKGTAKGKGAIKQLVQDWVKMVHRIDVSSDAADAIVIWEYGRSLLRRAS